MSGPRTAEALRPSTPATAAPDPTGPGAPRRHRRPLLVAGVMIAAIVTAEAVLIVLAGIEYAVLSWSLLMAVIGVGTAATWGAGRHAGQDSALLRVLFVTAVFGVVAAWVSVALWLIARPGSGAGSSTIVPADLAPPVAWFVTATSWVWVPVAVLPATLGLVLFPDGRLPSPRWRPVVPFAIAGMVALALDEIRRYWPTRTLPDELSSSDAISTAAVAVFATLVTAVAVSSLVVRYRLASGVVRRQIRWLVVGAMAVVVVTPIGRLGPVTPGWEQGLTTAAASIMATAYGIAIVRHRSVDVDVVINRSIVLLLMAAFITATYVTAVVGLGSLLGDRSNVVLSIAATALVAVLFEPVRGRVQHWANVVVYGRRATPFEVLAGFADRLRHVGVDAAEPMPRLASLLRDGTGASTAEVWLADDEGLVLAATSPATAAAPTTTVGSVRDLVADHALPVVADGETLGALAITKRRGDEVSTSDRRLVAELGGQATLVLRNARLRSRLRARLDELTRSRRRLVDAQDAARRRIERDLHDGAQQELVALKVKLGLARSIARREGADRVADVLGAVADDADAAVESLRELARGIYPPLLEAEGLVVALRARARTTDVAVEVEDHGVGRYARELETAVYFCVLEALTNAVKHADATLVTIGLEDTGDELRFRVTDDGRGIDTGATANGLGLHSMADRLDTVGGRLTVESRPTAGTTVRGTVPHGRSPEQGGSGYHHP